MKVLISPDKFKGSLSAQEVCEAIDRGVKRFDDRIETIFHPLADGGEATFENLQSSLKLESVMVEEVLFSRNALSYLCKIRFF